MLGTFPVKSMGCSHAFELYVVGETLRSNVCLVEKRRYDELFHGCDIQYMGGVGV
jgi:hypothetical protein